MLKRFRCWLYGHDWVQKGYNSISHTTYKNNEIIDIRRRDHYLFFCRCCFEIKEHSCEQHYFDLSEDAPVFAECMEDEDE